MKQLYQASESPHYIFKYPNQSFVGETPFTYQKNFLNKKELKLIEKLSKTLSYEPAQVGGGLDGRIEKQKRTFNKSCPAYQMHFRE